MRWLALVFTLVSITVTADEARIKQAITGINPMIQIESVNAVDQTPFFEVTLTTGERIYTDATGSHFIAGDLYQVSTGGVKNLTDIGRRADRQALLSGLDESKLVRHFSAALMNRSL